MVMANFFSPSSSFDKCALLVTLLCLLCPRTEGLGRKPPRSQDILRNQRNVAQLAYLVNNFSPFDAKDMISHGHWCGYGGDRKGDGSTQDACDDCCRKHDLCFDTINHQKGSRKASHGMSLNFGLSDILSLGLSTFFPHGSWSSRRGKGEDCHPYVVTYEMDREDRFSRSGKDVRCVDEEGTCGRKVCDCDLEFVQCLRGAVGCFGEKEKL